MIPINPLGKCGPRFRALYPEPQTQSLKRIDYSIAAWHPWTMGAEALVYVDKDEGLGSRV